MNVIKSEKLIEGVKQFPVLYDQTQEKYHNADYRERVWKVVAKNLNVEGQEEECKKRWANIRDGLRRARHKRKTKSGQAATSTAKYKYEDILEFLIPHIAERKGLNNVPGEEEYDGGYDIVSDSLDQNSLQETSQQEDVSNLDEHELTTAYGESPIPEDTNIHSRESPSPPLTTNQEKRVSATKRRSTEPSFPGGPRKISCAQVNPLDSQLMAYVLTEIRKAPNSQACNQHPVDAFLAGIAPTLKSFNPVILNEAKTKIFCAVQECELKQLRMSSQERFVMPHVSADRTPSSPQTSDFTDNF